MTPERGSPHLHPILISVSGIFLICTQMMCVGITFILGQFCSYLLHLFLSLPSRCARLPPMLFIVRVFCLHMYCSTFCWLNRQNSIHTSEWHATAALQLCTCASWGPNRCCTTWESATTFLSSPQEAMFLDVSGHTQQDFKMSYYEST